MTAEHEPAGFCLPERSQAELAGLVVNNKSPLSPPASDCRDVSSSCGVYFIPRASHRISLKLINENESSVDSAVVYWWQIGPHQNEYEFRPPCEPAPCPTGCKPIRCWCSRDSVLWAGTQYSLHFPQRRGGRAGVRDQICLFVVLVQCRTTRGWKAYLSKNQKGGKKREERGKGGMTQIHLGLVCSSACWKLRLDPCHHRRASAPSASTLELRFLPCSSPLTSLTGRSYQPFFLLLKQCERRCRERVCVSVCAESGKMRVKKWRSPTVWMRFLARGTNAAQVWLKVCGFRGSHITYVTMQLKSFK